MLRNQNKETEKTNKLIKLYQNRHVRFRNEIRGVQVTNDLLLFIVPFHFSIRFSRPIRFCEFVFFFWTISFSSLCPYFFCLFIEKTILYWPSIQIKQKDMCVETREKSKCEKKTNSLASNDQVIDRFFFRKPNDLH